MSCKRCYSHNQSDFGGEVAMHFPGLKGLDKPIVWVFSELKVCLDCGFSDFTVPERELRVLEQGMSAEDELVSTTKAVRA